MFFDFPRDEKGEIEQDMDGNEATERVNILGEGAFRMCKWTNAWGSEVYTARQAGVREPATLTLRFNSKITSTCIVYRGRDPHPYEVISLNDVEDRHVWLEIKVERMAAAK